MKRERTLRESNCVLFYRDGLVEAHDPEGAMFDFTRLRALGDERGEEQSLAESFVAMLKTQLHLPDA